MRQIYLSCC